MATFTARCRRIGATILVVLAFAPEGAPAQPALLDPVVVTATRRAERSFDVPASVDSIDGATIREGQPAINLSESLVRVPGIFAANRSNYAQDIQISSRGFGARATFGVRGVRLYQDFIPATMPDGQGQTGSFSLLSAQRIEALRGPFSTLYGNASGGVIAVFTEDPPASPVVDVAASVGSYRSYNVGIKAGGTVGRVGYVIAANGFGTDGYRDHSAATRDVVNAKLVWAAGEATRVTLIGSSQHQPDSQDPLGLTQAQVDANPRQADPAAELFDTRKTVNQMQGGVAVEHSLAPSTTLRVTGYAGHRQIGQYLALTGIGPTSSGGVVNLDRDYGGLGARLIWRSDLAGGPLTVSVGIDGDRMSETRQGFVNDFGTQGALRRDEDDTVQSGDVYLEMQWQALAALSLTLGVRSSRVRYEAVDHYVTAQNPDDSGARTYTNTSPIAGLVFHAREDLNLYLSYGQGFETPTFAELAYRPVGPGLNFALEPALATAFEVGLKWRPTPAHTGQSRRVRCQDAAGDRGRHRNRRPHDVSQCERYAPSRCGGRVGRRPGRRPHGARQLHVAAGHLRAGLRVGLAANRHPRGLALARRAAAAGFRHAALDALPMPSGLPPPARCNT